MFGGHVALALAARRLRPEVSLVVLLVAAQGCDWVEVLLGGVLGMAGAALWSHSVPSVFAGGLLMLAAGWIGYRSPRAGAVLAALYLSHLPADLITGSKPLWPGAPPAGLRLYERPWLDLLLEGALLVWGWTLYRQSLPAAARRTWTAAALLLVLLAGQAVVDAGFAWREAVMEARLNHRPDPTLW